MLCLDRRLSLNGPTISYENGQEYGYSAHMGTIPNRPQRYFQLEFSLIEEPTEGNIPAFADMLRAVKQVTDKVGFDLEVLWDDISAYYSNHAYERIHRVENLMRKLITNFMLVNVGADWVDTSTPEAVQKAISNSKRKVSSNVLQTVDFITLSDYLLKAYTNETKDGMVKALGDIATIAELENFKEAFTPRSNWTRYFDGIVNCEEAYLKKRWERLYDLRCYVAHNAIIKKGDFEEITHITSDLEKILVAAIDMIHTVKVPEEEARQVVDRLIDVRKKKRFDDERVRDNLERIWQEEKASILASEEVLEEERRMTGGHDLEEAGLEESECTSDVPGLAEAIEEN